MTVRRDLAATSARASTGAPSSESGEWQDGDTSLRRTPDELLPGRAAGLAARRLGRQLRAWREAHGISQQDLATRLGMAQPNLARLEGGGVAPTLTTLALLADRLGVRVSVLPGRDAPEVIVEDATRAAMSSSSLCFAMSTHWRPA